jgi:hypothetical protein
MHPTGLADTQLTPTLAVLFSYLGRGGGRAFTGLRDCWVGLVSKQGPRQDARSNAGRGRAQLAFRNQSIADRSLDAEGTRFYLLVTCIRASWCCNASEHSSVVG